MKMKIYEKQDFIDFCKSKGDATYSGGDICNCAMTQFMKSKDARVRRSYIGEQFDEFRVGVGEYGFSGGEIVRLRITAQEALAVVQVMSGAFADAAKLLENEMDTM